MARIANDDHDHHDDDSITTKRRFAPRKSPYCAQLTNSR